MGWRREKGLRVEVMEEEDNGGSISFFSSLQSKAKRFLTKIETYS